MIGSYYVYTLLFNIASRPGPVACMSRELPPDGNFYRN